MKKRREKVNIDALKGVFVEQICFFDPVKESTFDEKIDALKERLDTMRRGFFKRYDIYQKEIETLEKDIDTLVHSFMHERNR